MHLLKRGYKSVTIIDRASELPAADAASTDINKSAYRLLGSTALDSDSPFINVTLSLCLLVVRSAYEDEYYTILAREAIDEWRRRDVWGDTYRE